MRFKTQQQKLDLVVEGDKEGEEWEQALQEHVNVRIADMKPKKPPESHAETPNVLNAVLYCAG